MLVNIINAITEVKVNNACMLVQYGADIKLDKEPYQKYTMKEILEHYIKIDNNDNNDIKIASLERVNKQYERLLTSDNNYILEEIAKILITYKGDLIIDDFIDDVFLNRPFDDSRYSNSSNYKTDSDEDGVTLTINVPGYNDKLIDVSVSGDKLTIEGKAQSGDTDGFNYSFTINDNLDSDGIDATVIDGVLTVSIQYAEEVKPRKIKVKIK